MTLNGMTQPHRHVLICGTPGTGKSTLSATLAEQTGMRHVDVNEVARENDFYDGFDEERQCKILDEDTLLDELEEILAQGPCVVDYHAAEMFPRRWFSAVFVLRCETAPLFDRLKARGYAKSKVDENVTCEIQNVLLEEAREAYDESIVFELASNTPDEMETNVETIVETCAQIAASGNS